MRRVMVLALVLLAGCGSRVADDRLQKTLGRPGEPTPAGGVPARQDQPTVAVASEPGTVPAAAPTTTTTMAGPGRTETGVGVPDQGVRTTRTSAPPAESAPPVRQARDSAGHAEARSTASAVVPVVIGSVGTLSGPVGAAMQGGPLAVRVWAKARNAAGGLGGRPVQVVVADDGGDPFRYQAILRELVEHKGVVAFVSNMAAFTLASGSAYLEQKRVPVIGGDLTSAMWNDSPMFFPQAGGEQALVWGMVANGAATGKRRFGSLACRESEGCTNADRYWFDRGWVAEAGMEPAYRARISIAQPDYTAECLTAQRAGVEVLAVVADGATGRRVAVSCARQGYRPILSIAGPAVDERLTGGGPNEVLEGTLGTVVTFPYVLADSPATEEFRSTMSRFGTGELSAAAAQGWVSAKLFERAARGAEPLTPERILEGLWSLSGETLGGITAPRTFAREQKTPDVRCFFVMKLTGGAWTAPRGSELVCRR